MTDTISLKLRIKYAHNLIKRSILKCPDPFIQIFVNGNVASTKFIEKTVNPVWNESFELSLQPYKDKIEILVWNHRLFMKRKANAFLGRVLLSIDDLGEETFYLCPSPVYPHKSVSGYIVVELSRMCNTHMAPPTSTHQIPPLPGEEQFFELALPKEFERKVSESGRVYFLNLNTGSRDWLHPAVPRNLRKIDDFSCLGPLPLAWDSCHNETGRVHFINRMTRTTQYTDPRLLQALSLPNGANDVMKKLREAGKIIIEPRSSSLMRSERVQSDRERSLNMRRHVPDNIVPKSNIESTSHDHSPLFVTSDETRLSIRSHSSGQIQTQELTTSLAIQLNSNVTTENGDTVCENDIAPLPLQRQRISRPTTDYVLNNKHYIEVKLQMLRLALKAMMVQKLCIIETSRDNILEESYLALMRLKPLDMRRRLVLKFTGEEGLDYGGVAREWFYLLSETLFSCRHGLFETNDENDGNLLRVSPLSWINEDHLSYFHFIGRVIGMAIFHGYHIDADFCKVFYKNILNKKPILDDFKEMDPIIFNSLTWILEHNIDQAYLDLTFSIDQEVFGELTVIDLCANGRCIPVTENVKGSYVEKYVEYQLMEKCHDQYKQIKNGIYKVLPDNCLSMLNEDEFEVLLTGISEINIDDWKRNTRLKNCTEDEPLIKWFWDTVSSFTEQQRTKLLQFVTGSSRIPLLGFESLRGSYGSDEPKWFTIKVILDANPQSLPQAHTCFNRLDLPPYLNAQSLHDKLTCAIEETCGFALL